jgi:hydroxymethylbilane synthase
VKNPLIVGSRGSALALTQTDMVIAALQRLHPGTTAEIHRITTRGDRVLDKSLSEIGGKGVFVKEIEDALLAGDIDCAVHSFKDLPAEQPEGLAIVAILQREDARDVLVTRDGRPLEALPAGVRIGTGSLRRVAQLRAIRPDLEVADIRGNVDTRLRKLDAGQYDGIVLAAAGLIRLGLHGRVAQFFDPDEFLPAPGQGALAVEMRIDDRTTRSLLAPLDHRLTHLAVTAEYTFMQQLGGGCQLPIAAHARVADGTLTLRGMIADSDASNPVYGQAEGSVAAPAALGQQLADQILRRQHERR